MQSLNSFKKPKENTRKNEMRGLQFIGHKTTRRCDAKPFGAATPDRSEAYKFSPSLHLFLVLP